MVIKGSGMHDGKIQMISLLPIRLMSV